MADRSRIEWTEATWNPVTGCTEVSEGCDHCYARTFAERFRGVAGHPYEQGFDLKLHPNRLDQPLRWKRSRVVFVNSMSDLFQHGVPHGFIAQVFAVMALAQQHTFQVLTKRPGPMASLLSQELFVAEVYVAAQRIAGKGAEVGTWPLPNVWLGTSVENQRWADVRIPLLIDTSATVRFLSCEPLLGLIDLERVPAIGESPWLLEDLGWVIVGGESGFGARPMDPEWARSLRNQCAEAGIPFFFKQWGGRTPKAGGRELDGRTWDEMPTSAVSPDVAVPV